MKMSRESMTQRGNRCENVIRAARHLKAATGFSTSVAATVQEGQFNGGIRTVYI